MPVLVSLAERTTETARVRAPASAFVHLVNGGVRQRIVVSRGPALQRGQWPKQTSGRAAPTVEATVDGDGSTCVLVVVHWAIPGVTSVVLTRVYPDGTTEEVRGSPVLLSDGVAVFWDCEAPLNTPISYTVSSPESTATATSGPVTVTVTGFGWLKDPLAPGAAIELVAVSSTDPACDSEEAIGFVALSDDEYDSATGVFNIVGAALPRTVAQTRRGVAGTLTLVSRQLADRERLLTLLGTGRDLLLQLSSTGYGWGTYGSGYLTVGRVTSGRVSAVRMTRPQRVWTLPYRQVDAPPNDSGGGTGGNGVGAPGATWGDLYASGLTWGDLAATGLTWQDVAEGEGY